MDVLTAILSRASAVRLAEPGPTDQQLDELLRAGVRAPDHGRLAPWRFIVIEGDARQKLGDVLRDALLSQNPDASAEQAAAEAAKPLRAPTILVTAAAIQAGNRIPALEQMIAVAAATQNICLAAHAMGMGVMWKTGAPAYDRRVKQLLGLSEQDFIVGFLYLGTAEKLPPPRKTEITNVVRWL